MMGMMGMIDDLRRMRRVRMKMKMRMMTRKSPLGEAPGDQGGIEPGPARGGSNLFLAKARATSASTASFRDLTLPIICCLHCQPWHDSRECAALTDFVATQLHFAARANGGAPEPISTQCATWQLGRILYPQILNKQNKQI